MLLALALTLSTAYATSVGSFASQVPACHGGLMDDALVCVGTPDACHGGLMDDAFRGTVVVQSDVVSIPNPGPDGSIQWPYDLAHFACYGSGDGGVYYTLAGSQAPLVGFSGVGAWISWNDNVTSMFPVQNKSLCGLTSGSPATCYKAGFFFIGVESVGNGYVFSIL